MTNAQMVPNRFGRWAKARRLVSRIQTTLAGDGLVIMATYTKAWQYDRRSIDAFKATPTGAFHQRGKRWECIDGCGFQFYTKKGS